MYQGGCMRKLLYSASITLLFIIFFITNSHATIFYQDNFDSCTVNCIPVSTIAPPNSGNGMWMQWMGPGQSATVGGVTHYSGEITSPGRGSSGKSLKLWRSGSYFDGYTGSLVSNLQLSAKNIYMRWYQKIPVAMDIVANANYQKMFRFSTSGGDLYVDLISDRSSGSLQLLIPSNIATPITSGNLPTTIWDGNWHCIEMQFGLDRSTYKLWIDGNLSYSNTSVSYGPVANATFSSYLQHFPLGNRGSNPMASYQSSWQAFEVDDIVIADTYIGPVGGSPPPTSEAKPLPPTIISVQ